MATRVQTIGIVDSIFASTYDFTVPAGGVAAGNFVVVRGVINADATTITGVTDSSGNTYAVDVQQASAASSIRVFVASGQIASALSNGDFIRVALSASAALLADAVEWSGIATVSALDKTASQEVAFGTAWTSTATAATTQATELLVGVAGLVGDIRSAPTAPWTEETDQVMASGGGRTLVTEYQTVAATGTYAAQGTWASSGTSVAAIATYKLAAAGGTTYPQLERMVRGIERGMMIGEVR